MNDSNAAIKIAIAILAGGKSSRMGTPKAGIKLATGKSLFDHVYYSTRELELPRIAVGHIDGIERGAHADLQVLPDEVTGRGPVGALLGIFRSNIASHYLVMACDQPFLTSVLLRSLLAKIDKRPTIFCGLEPSYFSPLPGLYPAGLLPMVEELLKQPRPSLRDLLTMANARTIALNLVDWDRLRNANTPQDVEEINAILRANS